MAFSTPSTANFPQNNRHRPPSPSVLFSVKPAMLLLIPFLISAQTAQQIMAKVAENQDRAEAARTSYVYQQKILVRMLRSNGKLAREEDREYTVAPGPSGITREMVHFSGKYGVDGKEFPITEPGQHYRDKDIDANVAKNLADGFGGDEHTRDGVNEDLFPLTARKQTKYKFTLAGEENWHGHPALRILFEPAHVSKEIEIEWAGEALIDKTDFSPVLITTHLAKGVPLAVKIFLGTNIRQIGFKLTYEKVGDGVWFPVNYSGEFGLRILFGYARTIGVGMVNSGFRKADVQSTVEFEK
jgi:hypothetical protein